MPDDKFCQVCYSNNVEEWPDKGLFHCWRCGWDEVIDENAAEQRNEAISDGQKSPSELEAAHFVLNHPSYVRVGGRRTGDF